MANDPVSIESIQPIQVAGPEIPKKPRLARLVGNKDIVRFINSHPRLHNYFSVKNLPQGVRLLTMREAISASDIHPEVVQKITAMLAKGPPDAATFIQIADTRPGRFGQTLKIVPPIIVVNDEFFEILKTKDYAATIIESTLAHESIHAGQFNQSAQLRRQLFPLLRAWAPRHISDQRVSAELGKLEAKLSEITPYLVQVDYLQRHNPSLLHSPAVVDLQEAVLKPYLYLHKMEQSIRLEIQRGASNPQRSALLKRLLILIRDTRHGEFMKGSDRARTFVSQLLKAAGIPFPFKT